MDILTPNILFSFDDAPFLDFEWGGPIPNIGQEICIKNKFLKVRKGADLENHPKGPIKNRIDPANTDWVCHFRCTGYLWTLPDIIILLEVKQYYHG